MIHIKFKLIKTIRIKFYYFFNKKKKPIEKIVIIAKTLNEFRKEKINFKATNLELEIG